LFGVEKGISMTAYSSADVIRQSSTWSTIWGVLLIVLGMLAIGSPFLAAVAVSALVAWLVILAGSVHIILAFQVHRASSVVWKVLVGLTYLIFGGCLLMHPVTGVASITLLLASLFLIEGILDIVLFFQMRSMRGSNWVLVDGIITLLLGVLIAAQWPSSSVWAIGTLVDASMIISGVSRVMFSSAGRGAAVAAEA
jgi:uncharacterized membrane protein HdeD (DUF308 family)